MLCAPAIYISSNGELFKYNYMNCGHIISCDSVNDSVINGGQEILAFLNSISSSEVSQLVTISTKDVGIITQYCEEYCLIKSYDIICTLNRFITSPDKFMKSEKDCNRIYTKIAELHSDDDMIYSYWRPIEYIDIKSATFRTIIHGFVNCNRDKLSSSLIPSEIYHMISTEMIKIFNLKKNDIDNKLIKVAKCYENEKICRFIIYRNIENEIHEDIITPKEDKPKKKFKLFGGD